MRRLHTRGHYASDGAERREKVRSQAGHRCIRCGHPFKTGEHGKGEWTPCDNKCTHKGPFRFRLDSLAPWDYTHRDPDDAWSPPTGEVTFVAEIEAQWRILTVHHFDGDKSNDAWWNTIALCQRCHLTVQCRVDPDIPFFFEHSEWAKLYVAGFYAWKYEGRQITREEAAYRTEELLSYERRDAPTA